MSNTKNFNQHKAQWRKAKQEILAMKRRYDWILSHPEKWEEKAPLFEQKVIDEQYEWFNQCGNLAILEAYAPLLFWADMIRQYFKEGGFDLVAKMEKIYSEVWDKYVEMVNEKVPFEEEKL